MPKISIIVPVYNTEKYLQQCLDSIISQTLKDIEIICVNDGSTDNSLNILKEYAERDDRIKIISKANSGYGHSMNIGIENACGDYIGIVESDDYVELNMFETLYQKAIEYNVDIVKSRFFYYDSRNDTNKESEEIICPYFEVIEPLKCMDVFGIAPSIWSCLYKKSLIKDNNIKFLETPGASYQDTSFAYKTKACARNMIILKDAFLHYRTDNENSSVNSSDKSDFVIYEYEEIKRFLAQKGLYNELRKSIALNQFNCYNWNYNRLRKDLKQSFVKKIAKEYRKNLLNGNMTFSMLGKKRFLKYALISFFPSLYYYVERLQNAKSFNYNTLL